MIGAIIQLLALLAVGSLLLNLAWHRPGWVIFAAISIAILLELFQIGTDGLDIGFNLYVGDALSIVVLGTGFLALKRSGAKFPRDAVPCLAILALVALSVSRGVSLYGLKAAGNSARSMFSFVTPAVAIMLLQPIVRLDAGRVARWIVWAGLFLSAVALLRWGGVLPVPVDLAEDTREVTRVLGSDYGCLIGLAFIAAVYLALAARRSMWWWVGAGMLGGITFALQHRSVWVATAAGIAWLAFRTARQFRARWLALGAMATVGLCVIILAAPRVSQSTREIATTDVQEAESENSTLAWRVAGYAEASTRLVSGGPVDMLIGPPAGWAANLFVASAASTFIHSRYVGTLAYYGVLGLTVLLLWFGMLAKRVGWPSNAPLGSPACVYVQGTFVQALLIAELVYIVAYTGGILQGAVLGMIWVAAKQRNVFIGAERAASANRQFSRRSKAPTLAS